MSDLLGNVYFWTGLALAIFLVGAVRYGGKPTTQWLDGEIAKIREQLDQAKKLRAEAEKALAEYQIRQREAERDAQDILNRARAEADAMRTKAESELQASLARREQQAMDRIARAESEALRDVKQEALALALQAVEQIARAQLSGPNAMRLIDQAIAAAPEKLKKAS